MRAETTISEGRACRLAGITRSVLRYESRQSADEAELRQQIIDHAQLLRRFGNLRIHDLLRRDGLAVNNKGVYRLY